VAQAVRTALSPTVTVLLLPPLWCHGCDSACTTHLLQLQQLLAHAVCYSHADFFAPNMPRGVADGGQRQLGLGKAIALDVARGLAFLHQRHIVHLDLKSPNGMTLTAAIGITCLSLLIKCLSLLRGPFGGITDADCCLGCHGV
jgi:hypothetical protein